MNEDKLSRSQKIKVIKAEPLVAIPGGACYGRINEVYSSTCQIECVGEIPRMCVNATLRYWKYIPRVQENHNGGTVQ